MDKFQNTLLDNQAKLLSSCSGSKNKVSIECQNGHVFEITPSGVNLGRWCPDCTRKVNGKAKFTESVNAKGGQVLGRYLNSYSKVLVICSEGHKFEIRPNKFKIGSWCTKCGSRRFMEIEQKIRDQISSRGGKLLEDYIGSRVSFRIQCKNGHIFKSCSASLFRGYWCRACKLNIREEVAQLVQVKKGSPDFEYRNISTTIKLLCNKGHHFELYLKDLRAGKWCSKCLEFDPDIFLNL